MFSGRGDSFVVFLYGCGAFVPDIAPFRLRSKPALATLAFEYCYLRLAHESDMTYV